jgi:hypothetical protein
MTDIPVPNAPQGAVTQSEFAEVQPLPPLPSTTQPSPFTEVSEVVPEPEAEPTAVEEPVTVAEAAPVEAEPEPVPEPVPDETAPEVP